MFLWFTEVDCKPILSHETLEKSFLNIMDNIADAYLIKTDVENKTNLFSRGIICPILRADPNFEKNPMR